MKTPEQPLTGSDDWVLNRLPGNELPGAFYPRDRVEREYAWDLYFDERGTTPILAKEIDGWQV